MRVRNRDTLGVLVAVALAMGACAPWRGTDEDGIARVRERGARVGLSLPDPLEETQSMQQAAFDEVGLFGTEIERLQRLARFINGSTKLNFKYGARRTLTAREAFDARQGDCFAYANLFLAMARRLRVPVQFVRVESIRTFEEHYDSFFVAGHIAVTFSSGPSTLIAELPGLVSDWRQSLYKNISDEDAAVLFYNNRAVDLMESQDLAGAAKLLRFLTEVGSVADPWNNLGVVLLRQKRYDEALAVLERAIARFPDFEPLYANGALAANGAHRPALAHTMAEKARSLVKDDPYLMFAQGLDEMARQNAAAAVAFFREAAKLKPDNPLFLAWLASAYLSAGKPTEAREAFVRAQ